MHTETAAQNEIIDKIGEGLQNLLNGAKVGEGWRQRGGGGLYPYKWGEGRHVSNRCSHAAMSPA